MAELRSFIIGVTIAGVILAAGWVLFGGGGGEGSAPSVKFLGTPPATRTPQPAATRAPATQTTPQPGRTPAGGITSVPNATTSPGTTATTGPEPTSTLETAPTEEPTATPEADTSQTYLATAGPLAAGLQAQVDYLASITASPAVGDATWTGYVNTAAQNVQAYASQLQSLSAPACLAESHGSLVSGASLASQAAGQAITGAQNSEAGVVTSASGNLTQASGLIAQGVSAAQSASC